VTGRRSSAAVALWATAGRAGGRCLSPALLPPRGRPA